jgi:hypothetical protein
MSVRGVDWINREAVGGFPDVETIELLERALSSPGVPSEWRSPTFALRRYRWSRSSGGRTGSR